jgi:hypothetical protein
MFATNLGSEINGSPKSMYVPTIPPPVALLYAIPTQNFPLVSLAEYSSIHVPSMMYSSGAQYALTPAQAGCSVIANPTRLQVTKSGDERKGKAPKLGDVVNPVVT